jgi:hypothetical protein
VLEETEHFSGGVKNQVAKIVHCGLTSALFEVLCIVFQATVPASFERNFPFLPWASIKSCEDCPLWGALLLNNQRRGHPATVALGFL